MVVGSSILGDQLGVVFSFSFRARLFKHIGVTKLSRGSLFRYKVVNNFSVLYKYLGKSQSHL